MTKQQTQAILDTYWKPKFRGNETLAATLREVVNQFKYIGITEKNILDIADELELEAE